MTAEVAEEAMKLCVIHCGRSRLSYLDASHAATVKKHGLLFLTSDGFVRRNATALGVVPIDFSSRRR